MNLKLILLNNNRKCKYMSRHAYLIMAHNEPDILNKLLLLLDDERNDIFIHYDKKCKLPPPV